MILLKPSLGFISEIGSDKGHRANLTTPSSLPPAPPITPSFSIPLSLSLLLILSIALVENEIRCENGENDYYGLVKKYKVKVTLPTLSSFPFPLSSSLAPSLFFLYPYRGISVTNHLYALI